MLLQAGPQRHPFPQCGGGIGTRHLTTSPHFLGSWPSCGFLGFSLGDYDGDLRRTLPGIPFIWTEHPNTWCHRWIGGVEQDTGHEDQALAPDLSLSNLTVSETSSLPFQSDVSYTSEQNGLGFTDIVQLSGRRHAPSFLPSLPRVSSEETQTLRTIEPTSANHRSNCRGLQPKI